MSKVPRRTPRQFASAQMLANIHSLMEDTYNSQRVVPDLIEDDMAAMWHAAIARSHIIGAAADRGIGQ